MAGAVSEGDQDDYRVEQQVGHLLRRAHQRATQIFLGEFARLNLTPTQWAALSKLSAEGALSQNYLGRLTAMDPATVQGVIRRLGERRLIERFSDSQDRRRTMIRLTPEGEAAVAAGEELGRRVTQATLAPLSDEEQARFLDMLNRIS